MYCKKCDQEKSKSEFGNNRSRKNGKSFYCLSCMKKTIGNNRNSKLYDLIYAKYNSKCSDCGIDNNLIIHHIIPKTQGGNDSENNLLLLCKSCHKKIHDGDFSNSYRAKVTTCRSCKYTWLRKKIELKEFNCPKCHVLNDNS